MLQETGAYIEYILRQKGNIYLPGMGSIDRTIIPSRFNPEFTAMYSPATVYVCNGGKENPESVAQWIACSKRIPLHQALKEFKSMTNELKSALLRGEECKIGRLGTLKFEKGNFLFLPRQQHANGNPYHKLVPVSSIIEPKVVYPTIEKSYSETKKESEWVNLLAAMLIGALFVLSYQRWIEPGWSRSFPVMEWEYISDKEGASDESIWQEEDKPPIQDTDSVHSGHIFQFNPDSSVVSIARADQSIECIIITGVFTNGGNTERMLKRIKDKGYKPYIEQVSGATRVGIAFPCEGYDLKKVITEVRRTFNSRAWYLYPQISI
ncbi:MAG TPA: hypothetical protein PKC30_08125 [Saprospiraceae bacterium]|nr:hypothetical protein [Saprospiraceae bacterium]